jgi:parallel beta-helix repeat protein
MANRHSETQFIGNVTFSATTFGVQGKAVALTVAPTGTAADYNTDGTADQTEINNAINAANTAGGGIVLLREGTYTISSAISIKNNVLLLGEGYTATIIKKVASGNFSAIAGSTVNNFAVRDLKIDGNKTNSATGRGLSFNTCTNVLVNRVYVTDAVEGIFNAACSDITYKDCISDSNYEWNYYTYGGTRIKILTSQSLNAKAGTFEGFGMAFYQNCSYCEAVGNYIYNSAHNGLQMNAGSATADVVGMIFRDNTVVSAGNRGIMVTNDNNTFYIKRAAIVNNRVVSSADQGIYLINVYDSSVEGNKSSLAVQGGIAIETSQNCIITGNTCLSNTKYGINFLGTTNSVISGNVCLSNGFKGIYLQDQSLSVSTGNIIIGNRSLSNTQGGIHSIGSSDSNIFIGNNCANNTTSNMSLVGSSNIVRDNIGYITENSGTTTVANGATTATVTHGLGTTPAVDDITLTPTNNMGNATKFWVSSPTSTQFTINVNTDPGATTATFAWRGVIL